MKNIKKVYLLMPVFLIVFVMSLYMSEESEAEYAPPKAWAKPIVQPDGSVVYHCPNIAGTTRCVY